jgi:hypothetical protein
MPARKQRDVARARPRDEILDLAHRHAGRLLEQDMQPMIQRFTREPISHLRRRGDRDRVQPRRRRQHRAQTRIHRNVHGRAPRRRRPRDELEARVR